MKNLIYPLIAIVLLLTSATIHFASQSYEVGDGYDISFNSKDPSGQFKVLKGTVVYDEKNLDNSSFSFSIDVASISTGNGMKNKKALTTEWFNEAKYPTIDFVSTKVIKTDEGIEVQGNLKIKGISKFRKIPVKAVPSKGGWEFTGTFWVDRSQYKVGKPSETVPNKLKITYTIPVKTK